jgi:hypothetical protein
MLRRVALVRTDVSEGLSASIRVTGIGELGTLMEALSSSETSILTRAKSQKTPFFIVTTVKIANHTGNALAEIRTDVRPDTRQELYRYANPFVGDVHRLGLAVGVFRDAPRTQLRRWTCFSCGV